MLIITQKNNKTFRGEEGEMEGEDAAVTNGAATNGEKVSEEARPKAEWVVASKSKRNILQESKSSLPKI